MQPLLYDRGPSSYIGGSVAYPSAIYCVVSTTTMQDPLSASSVVRFLFLLSCSMASLTSFDILEAKDFGGKVFSFSFI